ncbi:hypothetical protein BKA62DRAFT_689865 [Auriculariales sp. MPI-PUGE-AT-0066]|nr:hypothetical protein BKA62DRAFT_689865 [Auriculariales sp. MPI-PUGE-AT-0066]
MAAPTLHLIYVHGFRGDHTSFLSFPSDVHDRVVSRIGSRFKVESYLYPTYPSVRPLAQATDQFLTWLEQQPAGPVVLIGHSMGGLLIAEAAISPRPVSQRIVGIIGMDAPLLGLHPHVIISGIASLIPRKDTSPAHREEDPMLQASKDSSTVLSDQPSRSSLLEAPRECFLQRHLDDPLGGVHRWIVKNLEFGSSMYDARGLLTRYDGLVQWSSKGGDRHFVNYWTTTIPPPQYDPKEAPELLATTALSPSVTPGLGRDSSKPVFSLPFGSLPSKPSTLEHSWWHSSLPDEAELRARLSSYLPGLRRVGQVSPATAMTSIVSQSSSHEPLGSEPKPHHFIVLPYNEGDRRAQWYRIVIAGAEDEVSAHQGIFMRHRNLAYDDLAERLSLLTAPPVDALPQTALAISAPA